MKTYNGKNITKKHIESVLRSQNPTEIFRLYHHIYGGKVEKSNVYVFIMKYAPTAKVVHAAYDIAYDQNAYHNPNRRYIYTWDAARQSSQWRDANRKHLAIQCLRENIARGINAYTKRPIMGHTHLYFASPVFRHKDYNKWQAMEIKGNEHFCEMICRLADKYF